MFFLRSLIVPNSLYVHKWITIVAGPTDRVRRAIWNEVTHVWQTEVRPKPLWLSDRSLCKSASQAKCVSAFWTRPRMQTCIETFMHEQNELDMELKRQLHRIQAIKIPPSKRIRHAWPSPEEGFPMSRTMTLTQVKEECSSEDEDDAWVECM